MPEALERLAELLHRSRSEPERGEWLALEREFGIVFPKQYKSLVDEFGGTSSWWNNSLHILSPIRGGNYQLRKHADRILSVDREDRESNPEFYPFNVFPEEGGVFPWAISDYATLYWITRSGPSFGPDQWPILIRGLRSFEYEVHFEPTACLLYLIATGTLRSMVLPEE